MTRRYRSPAEIRAAVPNVEAWGDDLMLHPAVAVAIHALESGRAPDRIARDPTEDEFRQVSAVIEEYVRLGDFEMEPDCEYFWGLDSVGV